MKKIIPGLLLAIAIYRPASAAEFSIDPGHSDIGFTIRHLMVTNLRGSFNEVSGTFSFDPKKLTDAKVSAKINAASIDTKDAKRDEHLRSPDFFDVQKYPDAIFVSRKVTDIIGGKFNLHGDLTLHGITKPVVLAAQYNGENKDPQGNLKAGFSATTTIKRKEFGITWNKTLDGGGIALSEDVKLELEIQGLKK